MSNIINRLVGRIRRLEKYKPRSYQFYNSLSIPYFLQQNIDDIDEINEINENIQQNKIYYTNYNEILFKHDIQSNNYKIIDIRLSSSFIVNFPNFVNGSVIIKMKINDSLLQENEVALVNNGYSHITLNYVQPIDIKSIYTVEIFFESCITSPIEIENPMLNIRNNGASLSIILL